MSDQVAVMQVGRVVDQNDNKAVLQRPHHAYTRSLLAAVLRMAPAAACYTTVRLCCVSPTCG